MRILSKFTVEEISINKNYAEYQRRVMPNGDVEWWVSYVSEHGGAYYNLTNLVNDAPKWRKGKAYQKFVDELDMLERLYQKMKK